MIRSGYNINFCKIINKIYSKNFSYTLYKCINFGGFLQITKIINNTYNFKSRSTDNKNQKRTKLIKPSIILTSALLAGFVCGKTEQDSFNKTNTFEKYSEIKKQKDENFDWDKIEDYKKLTMLFYTSVALMLLLRIYTNKDSSQKKSFDD